MTEAKFLKGKVALVTGSSRGIGRAIALELAERGADIIVNYARKRSAANEVVARIEALGRRAIAIKANLADVTKIEAMFTEIGTTFGQCDIFIANAASGVSRPVLEVTDKHWDWTMDINARSVLHCTQRVLPYMEEAGWGRIVTISSQGSTRVPPNYGVIGISKAALDALTRYLAVELAPKHIIANVVSPGMVDTDALTFFPIDVQETITQTALKTPARRIVTSGEVAKLVAFLCSDAAEMIVGQTIVMDGGLGLLA